LQGTVKKKGGSFLEGTGIGRVLVKQRLENKQGGETNLVF